MGAWLATRDRERPRKLAASGVLWERRVAMIATLAFIRAGADVLRGYLTPHAPDMPRTAPRCAIEHFLGLVAHCGGVPDNSLAATLLTLAQKR